MSINEKQSSIDWIQQVNLVDPRDGTVERGVDIRLRAHRIEGVGRGHSLSGIGLDATELYAIPGLIDGHLHALGFLHGEVPGPLDMPWVLRQQKRNLSALLRSGITTVRDMCAPLNMVRRISRQADRFEFDSPRILYSGPMLTCPGGYPHYIDKLPLPLRLIFGPIREEITDASHARAVVEKLAASGVCCVKVAYQSMAYDDARSPIAALSPGLMRVLCEEADRYGLKVAMHQVYLKDLRALEDVPFGSLEHMPIDGPMTEHDVAQFIARNVPISSTLAAYGLIDHIDDLIQLVETQPQRFEPKPRRFLRETYAAMRRGVVPHDLFGDELVRTGARWMRHNLQQVAQAGARIVFGTDTGSGVGLPGCPRFEFEQLARCGLSNRQILASATCDAAEAIGRPELGRIHPGSRADIVLLRRNPLDDLGAIDEVAAVIRDGRLVYGQLSTGVQSFRNAANAPARAVRTARQP